MERISALIEKLRDQFASGADIDQLLLTAQLLEGELRYHRQKGTVPASPNVAVVMPNNGHRTAPRQDLNPEHERFLPPMESTSVRDTPAIMEAFSVYEISAEKSKPAAAADVPAPAAVPAQVATVWREVFVPSPEPVPAKEPAPVMQAGSVNGDGYKTSDIRGVEAFHDRRDEQSTYNPIQEVPTLTHQIPKESRRELNDTMAGKSSASLNESLKGPQRELSTVLTEAPIRDLRKAIGINDRYVFISELFRGDEIMYERSIKTINNFSIFQEAYYWMERELKLKLAWDQERSSTQLFYQLVRRRFS